MANPLLTTTDSRSFLALVTSHGLEHEILSNTRVGDLHEQLAAISHKLFVTRSRDLNSDTEARGSVGSAFATVSLGLEYASKNYVPEAATLLNENDAVAFFRIGNTLLRKLVDNAAQTREEAQLVSPPEMRGIPRFQEHIELHNSYERHFLLTLERGQLNITAPALRLRGNSLSRPVSTLQELQIAGSMLDNLRYRSEYLHTLPAEPIFDAEFPPDADDDMAYLITRHLIINIALYRQLEFHATEEDVDNFLDICCDTPDRSIAKSHLDFILGWIRHYLDLRHVGPDVKRYAVAYWRECLQDLEVLGSSRP